MSLLSKKTCVFTVVVAVLAGIAYGAFIYYPESLLRDIEGYRYVKWEVTERRGAEGLCIDVNCIQATQFSLLQQGNPVVWPGGALAMNPQGENPLYEDANNMIDGTVDTKWIDRKFNLQSDTAEGNSVLLIDAGKGNFIVFDGYRWATANDNIDRDPVSWNVYGSKNAKSWTLLDERKNSPVTANRSVFTGNYTFSVN